MAHQGSGPTRDMVLKVEIITSDEHFLCYKVTFTPLTKASARIIHEVGEYQLNIVDSHGKQSEILEFQAIPKLFEVGASKSSATLCAGTGERYAFLGTKQAVWEKSIQKILYFWCSAL
jgi:hypothetical protein